MALDWLLDQMRSYASREAMVFRDESVSYASLIGSYAFWIRKLAAEQVKPGQTVGLVGEYSPSLCGAFLALLNNSNIVVPLSETSSRREQEYLEIAQAEIVLTVNDEQYRMVRVKRESRPMLLQKLAAIGHPGMILFTSGTTGTPKAIVHDMVKFTERYRAPRDTLRTLSFLRFDHIGGVNTLLHTLANGGCVVCPDKLLPDDICGLIERSGVELLPTSPSFLNLLLVTGAIKRYDLSSLKMVTYGTEVMPEYTLHRLRSALPGVQFRQTYGLSEIGILRAKSQSSDSLLFKVGGEGVETKIQDGTLRIRSTAAMEGYLNAPDPFDEEGWFDTQDQVQQEGEFIRIIGRRSEIINVGGRKVYPAEVEEVLLQMPELHDVTVRGEPSVLLGSMVTATVNTTSEISPGELKQRIRVFCMDKLESYQIPAKVYIEDSALYSDRFKKMRG